MPTILNPYISFRDNARQAMEFYQSVLGGELEISTFGEGMPPKDPTYNDRVMHAKLTTDSGFILMAADTPEHMEFQAGAQISVSIGGDDADSDAKLSGYFTKLSEGGTVTVPMATAPWGDKFGMFTDKFGINWLVNIAGSQAS